MLHCLVYSLIFLLPFCCIFTPTSLLANPTTNFRESEGSGEFLDEMQNALPNQIVKHQFDEGEALPIVVPNEGAHTFSLNSELLEQILLDPKIADKNVPKLIFLKFISHKNR
jgi:hypothetical protein